jgi:hypothetical protein
MKIVEDSLKTETFSLMTRAQQCTFVGNILDQRNDFKELGFNDRAAFCNKLIRILL